jgi:hypothetical protein
LYKRGLYGNKLRTWYSLSEFYSTNHAGTFTLRYSGGVGGMYCAYDIKNVKEKADEFISKGAQSKNFIINESAPDENLLIQGEITRNQFGYSLFYSNKKGKMRDCLKDGIQVYGLEAKMLLQNYLFPSSFDDVIELLDEYPDHAIEFGAYTMALGDCNGRNTIIWEVRKY